MKKTFLFLAFVCIAMLFSSCNKEGVFNPKKKISKIYTYDTYTVNGTTTTTDKTLSEVWTWNKNILEKIDHYGSNNEITGTTTYTYDKKRVVRIDESYQSMFSNYSSRTEFIYDGKYLSEAKIYDGNELEATLKFTHQNGKISQIVFTGEVVPEENGKSLRTRALQHILPPQICKTLQQIEKKKQTKNAGKGSETTTITLTWNKDNITKLACVDEFYGERQEYSMEAEYDNYNNPFYGLFDTEMSFGGGNLCKNNIVKQTWVFPYEGDHSTDTYQYTYEGRYPVSCTHTDPFYDDTHTSTTEYEYK